MENFSRPLVDWYKKEARPLPWREEPTPYRVWVSEIMLQQTRIEAAREYFNRFTRAFPTVEALAAAELDEVLKLWEGLGYYSRARNLHKCAKTVCETYGGVFPPDAAALRALPGIGDYTAGAIASIAYGLPEPAVDGNVLRVLARMERFGESIGSDKVKKRFREALRDIYPTGECGAFTSALMELGETVCTVGTPSCARCPVAAYCAAHRCGEEALYPVLPEKKPRRIENRRVLLLLCGDTCAVQRRADSRLDVGAAERPFAGCAGNRRALRRGGAHFQPCRMAYARVHRPLQGEASGLCLGDASRARSARHAHGVPVLPKKTGGDGILNICVFGAARDEIGEDFMALGTALGRELAARGHTLVFGAGGHGMMGAAARGAYEMGGKIIGVVPYFFNTPGILFEHCTELIRMETMAERKTIMEERSDAFIALPGGIGTMEEIFEVITLSSLGRMQKKSAFLDAESYWEPAVELLRGAVEKGFAGRELNEHYARFTDVEACLDYLEK